MSHAQTQTAERGDALRTGSEDHTQSHTACHIG